MRRKSYYRNQRSNNIKEEASKYINVQKSQVSKGREKYPLDWAIQERLVTYSRLVSVEWRKLSQSAHSAECGEVLLR